MPEISIIIPCFNVENYVMRCFESLRNQTIGTNQLELIFVDDASTDRTWDILTQIEQSAPDLVSIIHLEENQRQGGARNIGISYARGTYIGFVDSDDWVEPDMYQQLYLAIQNTDSDFSFCRHVRDDGSHSLFLANRDDSIAISKETGLADRLITITSSQERADFIASNVVGCNVWDKLFRKDFLLKHHICFPEHLAYEDIYFSSLVYLYAQKVCILEQRLYHYFINLQSTVLCKNLAYHKDILRINELKWDAYQSRMVPSELKDAIEFDFLMTFYFTGIKILCMRFDTFAYDDFMQLKEGILKRIPNYHNNPYIHSHVPAFYKPLLTLLDHPVTQQDLNQVQQAFHTFHKTD